MFSSKYYLIATILIFVCGTLINTLAYSSIQPALALVFYLFFMLFFGWLTVSDEKKAFLFVFSICWFWAGVSAIYANYFFDNYQIENDPNNFFELATNNISSGLNIDQISTITTGAGAVIIWSYVYDFFSILGFNKERYLGILLNIVFVSSTVVIGLKIVKIVFKEDKKRVFRFVLLFSLCGLFWLFASIHLRDASILFVTSLLILYWVKYLQDPNFGKTLKIIAITFCSFPIFALLRFEFVFVPMAMFLAGTAALLMGVQSRSTQFKLIILALFVLLPLIGYLIHLKGFAAFETIIQGNSSYTQRADDAADNNSLGTSFVYNQPFFIKLLLSIFYLFVFPIPFWSGFQLQTSYHLFKSLNVIYMYIFTPLLLLAFWKIIRGGGNRTAAILFLVFITIGFIVTICLTSNETRHLGAFFVPLLVLSLIPDLSLVKDKLAYFSIFKYYISIIILGHLTWVLLKMF